MVFVIPLFAVTGFFLIIYILGSYGKVIPTPLIHDMLG